MRAAVVQLCSWGDTLIATALVRAMRVAHPDYHITFITTSACAGAIANNPDINELRAIPANKDRGWDMFGAVLDAARREFDLAVSPWAGFRPRDQWTRADRPTKSNFMYATARCAQELGLDVPDPMRVYLHPTAAEHAAAAALLAGLPAGRNIMVEIEGQSCQSFMNSSWFPRIERAVMTKYGGQANLLVSKGGQTPPEVAAAQERHPGRVVMLSDLPLRTVAAVYSGCDAFIGLSSGTSNACHGSPAVSGGPTGQGPRGRRQWFECVNDQVWDSTPLGTDGKIYHYGDGPDEFGIMLLERLAD